MSNDELIGSTDRQQQTMISEQDTTEHATAMPVDTTPQEVGVVDIPDVQDEQEPEQNEGPVIVDDYTPTNFSSMLRNLTEDSAVVRLVIRPRLHFIVNLFSDSLQQDLAETTTQYFDGTHKYNLAQPLSKYNEKSGRIGYLREPLRNFCKYLSEISGACERVVITGEHATLPIDMLVSEYLRAAEDALYGNMPEFDGVRVLPWTVSNETSENPEEETVNVFNTAVPASDYIRATSMINVSQSQVDVQDHGVTALEVDLHYIVHLRIPCLIRQNQDRFDRNLKIHFKYLENSGISSGLPTTISAAFRAKDIGYDPAVQNAFNWILDSDPSATVVSFRDAIEGDDALGIHGFSAEDYEESLFNGGDFLVAFNLNENGEG